MAEYIGICDTINWQNVVKDIENQAAAYIGPRHDVGDSVPGVEEVVGPLREAGYKQKSEGGNAAWDMFLPGTNFDEELIHQFMDYVGMTEYTNAWISRVLPGDVAPWHWDITDDEATLNAGKQLVRYHCHVSGPEDGHTIIVGDTCLYKQPQGAVWKWPERTSWHAGANAGLVPKYLFNIWG